MTGDGMAAKRMTRDEVVAAVERERARLVELVQRLAREAETRPVTEGGWTARDVLAHCIHWVGQLAFGLGATREPPPYVTEAGSARLPADEWNRRVVESYADVPLDRVLADFDGATDAVLERVRLMSDDDVNASGRLPWAPDEALWESIASETFGHWPDHSADLERALAWST
jgi:hypothetical protein